MFSLKLQNSEAKEGMVQWKETYGHKNVNVTTKTGPVERTIFFVSSEKLTLEIINYVHNSFRSKVMPVNIIIMFYER